MFKKIFIALGFVLIFNTAGFAYDTEAIALYNEGVDCINNEKYEDAIKSFKKALKVDNSFVDAYFNLGIMLEFTGNRKGALEAYKKILDYKPDDYDAICKIAAIYYDIGNMEKADYYGKKLPKNNISDIAVINPSTAANFYATSDIKEEGELEVEEFCEPIKERFEGFEGPAGMVKDSKGNLYVADFADDAIIFISRIGEKRIIAQKGIINGPMGLAIDRNDNVYVANYGSDKIVLIPSSGHPARELPILVKKPYFLMIDDEGTLYVSEQETNLVTRHKLIWGN